MAANVDLQRVEILDLRLGVGHDLGEGRRSSQRNRPCLPRSSATTCKSPSTLQTLGAFREHGRELLGGIVECLERGIDRRLIVGLFTLDHLEQDAIQGSCPVAFIIGSALIGHFLLRHDRRRCSATRSPATTTIRFIRLTPSSGKRFQTRRRDRDAAAPILVQSRACGLSFRHATKYQRLCCFCASRIAIQTRSAVAGMSM